MEGLGILVEHLGQDANNDANVAGKGSAPAKGLSLLSSSSGLKIRIGKLYALEARYSPIATAEAFPSANRLEQGSLLGASWSRSGDDPGQHTALTKA